MREATRNYDAKLDAFLRCLNLCGRKVFSGTGLTDQCIFICGMNSYANNYKEGAGRLS